MTTVGAVMRAGVAQQAAGAEDGVELAQHALRVVAAGPQFLDAAAQRVRRGKEVGAVDHRDVADLEGQPLLPGGVPGGRAERQLDHPPPWQRRERLAGGGHDQRPATPRRSGWLAASICAIMPPIEAPTTWARVDTEVIEQRLRRRR